MKKRYAFFLCYLLFSLVLSESNAQCIAELSVTSPLALNSPSRINGGGIGFGFYSGPIDLVNTPFRYGKKRSSLLALRFGGNFYFNGAGQKYFENIPLLSPGTGNATVSFSNTMIGLNFSTRLSSSLFDGGVLPYIEGHAGLRYFSSDMEINPDDDGQKSSWTTLGKISGLNTGGSSGLMIKVGDNCYIDTGVMWSHSEVSGEYVDIHSLKQIGSAIGYHPLKLPSDFLVFKVGISGYLDGSGFCNGDGSFWEALIDGLFSGGSGGGGGHNNINLIKF